MRRIREVLRLKYECGLSHHSISASTGMSKGSVNDYLRRADEAGMTWQRARELDDGAIEGQLFTAVGRSEPPERAPIDLQWVRREMRKTGVTLQLVWSEYRDHVLAGGGQQRPYLGQAPGYLEPRGRRGRGGRALRRGARRQQLHGVVASIEVKTNLTTARLISCGQNFASVRHLKPAMGSFAQMGLSHRWPPDKVLTAIITYEGMSLKGVAVELAKLDEVSTPDLVLDLSKGLIVKNHGLLLDFQEGFPYIGVENPAEGFMIFLTILAEITGTLSARGTSWRSYW